MLTRFWIPLGAAVFTVALFGSAVIVPELRPLHVLQALIYVAVVVLARQGSVWGFGAGFTVAAAWNSLNLFVTHLAQAGAVAFWSLLRTGEVTRVDTMMVTLGSVGHFILIVACVAALRSSETENKWRRFAGGGAIVLAYFALIVAVAAPH